jgi:hypothetical protein
MRETNPKYCGDSQRLNGTRRSNCRKGFVEKKNGDPETEIQLGEGNRAAHYCGGDKASGDCTFAICGACFNATKGTGQ